VETSGLARIGIDVAGAVGRVRLRQQIDHRTR
jgi:hypothetical protein